MQKDVWEKEYSERKDLPSSRTKNPSKALLRFLETHNPVGLAIDFGSGQGRNSIYLASKGMDVVGVEMIEGVITVAQEEAQKAGVGDKVKFINGNVADKLNYPDDHFELAVDMMTLHLLNAEERERYSGEVVRLLKPGGYFVFSTIAADSPAAQALFKTSPGTEPNSYIVPQTGMVEKGFTQQDLENMFAPLKLESLERNTQFTPAYGDVYERVYYFGIMVK